MNIKFLILSLLLLLNSCKSDSNSIVGKFEVVSVDSRMKSEKVCELKQNINLLGGMISDVNFIDDNHFSIISKSPTYEENIMLVTNSTPSSIFVYNTDGEQIKEFNKAGNGHGGYLIPERFMVKGNQSYLWCCATKKMNIYDYKTDSLINTFSKNVQCGILDVALFEDKILFYYGDHQDEILLDIFNDKGEFLTNIDTYSMCQRMLNMLSSTSKMFVKGDQLYYIHPDTLGYSKLNLRDYSLETHKIEDPNFVINRDITYEETQKRNFDRSGYLFNNSTVNSIYPYNDGFILEVYHGKMKIVEGEKPDMSTRYTAFYFFDKDDQFRERVVFSGAESKKSAHLIPCNGNLYKLEFEDKGTENEKYVLYKTDFI